MSLKLDPQSLMKLAKPMAPYLLAIAVVGVFGYTGWAINQAFQFDDQKVAAAAAPSGKPEAKVTFDKKTVETVKNLRVVPGEVAPTDLGKTDPFGN